MKKAEYYINVKLTKDVAEYPKVSGWVEEVEDSNGNKLKIGYDKRGTGWKPTELGTGMCCSTLYCKTRSECAEYVHNNIDKISEAYYKTLQSDWGKKFLETFSWRNANRGDSK